MGKGAHVAGALHIVLAAHGIDANALATDVPGEHCQIGNAHHRGRALAVLGDTQPVVDGGIAAGGVHTRRLTQQLRRHTGRFLQRLGGLARSADKRQPLGKLDGVAARLDKCRVMQFFRHDHVGHRVEYRDVGPGRDRQVVIRADMGRAHQLDAARIDHDQLRALAQSSLQAGAEYRVGLGGVRAHHQHHIGMRHRGEGLGAGGFPQGRFQAIARRRVADAGAGVDIVVAKTGPHQLLHQVDLLVGAARGADGADAVAPVALLDGAKALCGIGDRLLPGHRAPGLIDAVAYHRPGDTVPVGGVAESEAALDAGVTLVGLAVPVGRHAHHRGALELGPEGAADATVSAGSDHRVFRLAVLNDGVFGECRGGAGLDAGAAGHAFAVHERLALAGADSGCEAAPLDGQGESTLGFLAGAHAARTDDALGCIESEVRIGAILGCSQVIGADITVADFTQPQFTGGILQFAVAVGGTGEAVQRVVGDVQLHHVAAQAGQLAGLGAHHHVLPHRGGAGRRVAFHPVDLHQADPAGTKGLQRFGGAQPRNLDPRLGRGAHNRGAGRHGHRPAIDRQRDRGRIGPLRRAVILLGLIKLQHHITVLARAWAPRRLRKNPRENGPAHCVPERASVRPWRTGNRPPWCHTNPAATPGSRWAPAAQ